MKRCPQCQRDYLDDTLRYCLDDGSELLDGPATTEAATVTFSAAGGRPETEVTRLFTDPVPTPQRNRTWIFLGLLCGLLVISFFAYRAYLSRTADTASRSSETSSQQPITGSSPAGQISYWQMTEAEQLEFVRKGSAHVAEIIGDTPPDLNDEEAAAINIEIARFAARRDSLSQEEFQEGLRVIYGRASQYVPLIGRAFAARKVPAALGIYQAMIESEYRDCPKSPFARGPVGIFQFNPKTAARYDLLPADYCNIPKQADAAAHYMSDLLSDFGSERASWTLALLSFNIGEDAVREDLHEMRAKGIMDRDFWAIRRYRQSQLPRYQRNVSNSAANNSNSVGKTTAAVNNNSNSVRNNSNSAANDHKITGSDSRADNPNVFPISDPSVPPTSDDYDEEDLSYVIRFLAAAIIGESPATFGLPISPLTTVGE